MEAPAENASDLLRRFGVECSIMVESLGLALLLKADSSLRARLASFATGKPDADFALAVNGNQTWLMFSASDKVQALRILPDVPVIPFTNLFSVKPDLFRAIQTSQKRTRAFADASKLLRPVFDMGSMMTRQQYQVICPWMPLLEHRAYACHTRLLEYTDTVRPVLLQALRTRQNIAAILGMYWWSIHTMANMAMLSSDRLAGEWLAEMAGQFEWQAWTPTFALVRERTTWLAGVAARSAIAFGPPVVENYLRFLSKQRHPMKAFDALFGITAIAVGHPREASHIRMELERVRAKHMPRVADHSEYFAVAYRDAQATISSWETRQSSSIFEENSTESARGFAKKEAFSQDAAAPSRAGRLVGFEILPAIASSNRDQHYARGTFARREAALGATLIESVIRNAWGNGERNAQTLQ